MAHATAWGALLLAGFVVAAAPPIDDFWLALASARSIMAGADPFHAIPLAWSPTIPGALNPQWGAQLVFGLAGSLGVALAVNAALLSAGLLLTTLRARAVASRVGVALAMLAVVAALAPHVIVRPQSFSIALLPIALLLLERAAGQWWLPLAYGALIAAWANLHGAFVIGQVAAVIWAVVAIYRWLRTRRERSAATVLGVTALAALGAALLNPAGPSLLAYAYGQGTSEVVRAISVEWQPAWPWNPVGLLFWVILALVVAGRVVRRGAIQPAQGLLLVALAILAITGIRHIPWFLLAAAPVLAGDADAALRATPSLGRAFGRIGGILGASPRAILGAVVVLVIAFQMVRPLLPEALGRLTQDAPPGLASALDSQLDNGPARIVNEQTWGGYLAYRLPGRVLIAMDGRLEIRTADTWRWWFALMNGEGDPAATLRENGVAWAVLSERRTALIAELRAAGWTLEADDAAGVLLRAQSGS